MDGEIASNNPQCSWLYGNEISMQSYSLTLLFKTDFGADAHGAAGVNKQKVAAASLSYGWVCSQVLHQLLNDRQRNISAPCLLFGPFQFQSWV